MNIDLQVPIRTIDRVAAPLFLAEDPEPGSRVREDIRLCAKHDRVANIRLCNRK